MRSIVQILGVTDCMGMLPKLVYTVSTKKPYIKLKYVCGFSQQSEDKIKLRYTAS